MSDLIPWRAGLEVGMGMNSFTRQIALEGAVEIEESEDKTFTQSVEYTHRQINSQSEMAKALNIAAPLAIANGGISSTSDGNFINKKFGEAKATDCTFVLRCTVRNNCTVKRTKAFHWNAVPTTREAFLRCYGDSFISDILEGGEFVAVVSARASSSSAMETIAAEMSSQLSKVRSNSNATYDTSTIKALSSTEVSVRYSGADEVNPNGKRWDIDLVMDEASNFPKKVAQGRSRIAAVLRRYETLLDFQKLALGFTVPSFDDAGARAFQMLDDNEALSDVRQKVDRLIARLDSGRITEKQLSASTAMAAYPATKQGLLTARDQIRDARNAIVENIRLLKSNPEAVEEAPKEQKDTPKLGQLSSRVAAPVIDQPAAQPSQGQTGPQPQQGQGQQQLPPPKKEAPVATTTPQLIPAPDTPKKPLTPYLRASTISARLPVELAAAALATRRCITGSGLAAVSYVDQLGVRNVRVFWQQPDRSITQASYAEGAGWIGGLTTVALNGAANTAIAACANADGSELRVFYVSHSGQLNDAVRRGSNQGEFSPGTVGAASVTLDPALWYETRLAALYRGGGGMVQLFFQYKDGFLGFLTYDPAAKTWTVGRKPLLQMMLGGSMAAVTTALDQDPVKERLSLYLQDQTGAMNEWSYNPAGTDKDTTTAGTKFSIPVPDPKIFKRLAVGAAVCAFRDNPTVLTPSVVALSSANTVVHRKSTGPVEKRVWDVERTVCDGVRSPGLAAVAWTNTNNTMEKRIYLELPGQSKIGEMRWDSTKDMWQLVDEFLPDP